VFPFEVTGTRADRGMGKLRPARAATRQIFYDNVVSLRERCSDARRRIPNMRWRPSITVRPEIGGDSLSGIDSERSTNALNIEAATLLSASRFELPGDPVYDGRLWRSRSKRCACSPYKATGGSIRVKVPTRFRAMRKQSAAEAACGSQPTQCRYSAAPDYMKEYPVEKLMRDAICLQIL